MFLFLPVFDFHEPLPKLLVTPSSLLAVLLNPKNNIFKFLHKPQLLSRTNHIIPTVLNIQLLQFLTDMQSQPQ